MFVVRNLIDILAFRAARLRYGLQHRAVFSAPKIFLVNGSPKSGTTWVRMMLSALPGYFPGGHFTGKVALYRTARPGAVLHGHETFNPELAQVLKEMHIHVVCTMRDPRDQLVSNLFHLRRDAAHPFHARIVRLDEPAALRVVIEGVEGDPFPSLADIVALTESWRRNEESCRIVRYEDLLDRPSVELAGLFDYLGLPPDAGFLEALSAYYRFERVTIGRNIWRRGRERGDADPASHFRKGIAGDWKNYFQPEHISLVKEIAGQALIDWGYEQGLDW